MEDTGGNEQKGLSFLQRASSIITPYNEAAPVPEGYEEIFHKDGERVGYEIALNLGLSEDDAKQYGELYADHVDVIVRTPRAKLDVLAAKTPNGRGRTPEEQKLFDFLKERSEQISKYVATLKDAQDQKK